MNRYTIKQLEGMSDLQLARAICVDRLNTLKNPYSPLSSRLRRAIHALEDLDSRLIVTSGEEERP